MAQRPQQSQGGRGGLSSFFFHPPPFFLFYQYGSPLGGPTAHMQPALSWVHSVTHALASHWHVSLCATFSLVKSHLVFRSDWVTSSVKHPGDGFSRTRLGIFFLHPAGHDYSWGVVPLEPCVLWGSEHRCRHQALGLGTNPTSLHLSDLKHII